MVIEAHFKHFTSFITEIILHYQTYSFQLFANNGNL